MNSKELVRNMIAFLNERHDMDCATLRQRFAVCYDMSEDEAKKVILELQCFRYLQRILVLKFKTLRLWIRRLHIKL